MTVTGNMNTIEHPAGDEHFALQMNKKLPSSSPKRSPPPRSGHSKSQSKNQFLQRAGSKGSLNVRTSKNELGSPSRFNQGTSLTPAGRASNSIGRARPSLKSQLPPAGVLKTIPRKPPTQPAATSQEAYKVISENWKDMCKVLDSIPNGQTLKTKSSFSKADLIQIVQQFRKKSTQMEKLMLYEQQKAQKHTTDYNDMLEKIKIIKLEKKILEQRLTKIPEMESKIRVFETKMLAGLDMLRKSMIQNFVCLEFNRDLLDLI